MKKIIALIMCLCMALGMFAGCAKPDEVTEPTVVANDTISEETENKKAEESKVPAEWEFNADVTSCEMPADVTDAFLSAAIDETVKFIPIAYVANKKVEDGMIYRILCQAIQGVIVDTEDVPASSEEGILDGGADIGIDADSVDENNFVPSPELSIDAEVDFEAEGAYKEMVMLDVFVDIDGNVTVQGMEILNLDKIFEKTAADINDMSIVNMATGWVKNIEQSMSAMNGDVLMLFDNAVAENYQYFEALAYLACQEIDGGMNYAILCYHTTNDEVPVVDMAITFISEAYGKIEITNIVPIV